WSLFQLWYASPLPFALNWGIFNDTEARALHLGIAMFLGHLAYPARKSSPRDRMPWHDWVLAIVAAFCGAYLFLFYKELASRAGAPRRLARAPGVAQVADLREALRRGPRRVGVAHLPVRAAGLAAGQVRRRQLHDAGLVGPAGPPARRSRQGGGGLVGGQRP